MKDTQADVLALSAGLRSRAEIIAARGRDIADVDAEIAADTFRPATPLAALTQEPQNATPLKLLTRDNPVSLETPRRRDAPAQFNADRQHHRGGDRHR